MDNSKNEREKRGIREDNSEGMKIIKLYNCGSRCEYFIIDHFLLLHTFECSNPLSKKDGSNRELVGKELSDDFPSWCPLEDYK